MSQNKYEICIPRAQRILVARYSEDKEENPQVIQMIYGGSDQSHWYYRSRKYLDQPLSIIHPQAGIFIQAYSGPANRAIPALYGEGTYRLEEDDTNMAIAFAEQRLSQKLSLEIEPADFVDLLWQFIMNNQE